MDIKNQNKAMIDKIIKESAAIRENERVSKSESNYKKRNTEPNFAENIENFVPPVNTSSNNSNFTSPKSSGGVEIVDVEELDNDDNAQ
jgi:hypothetical protein